MEYYYIPRPLARAQSLPFSLLRIMFQIFLFSRKRLIDLENELTFAAGRVGGRDITRVWNGHVHTAM